jgi:ABC-type transport system involved in multi-copper enzyme maturation permease subunit
MKKFVYIFKTGDKKGRITGIISLILAVAAITLLVISASSAINGPLTEINALKIFISEKDLDSFEDEIEVELEQIEEAIENADQAYLDAFENEYGMTAQECLKLLDDVSFNGIVKLSNVFDVEPELVRILEIVIKVIIIYAVVLAGFVLLGALFMRGGLVITSMILSALFFLVFAGMAWFIAYAVICIAFSIFSKIFRGAYHDYKVIEKYKASQEKKTEAK